MKLFDEQAKDGKLSFLANSSNPELICLHGWINNRYSYGPLLESLDGKLSAAAIDLPGFANQLQDSDFSLDTYLEQLHEALQSFGHRLDIMGNSMGASLALIYSIRYPEHIDKLILRVPYINRQQFHLFPAWLLNIIFQLSRRNWVIELFRPLVIAVYKRIAHPRRGNDDSEQYYQKSLTMLQTLDSKLARDIIAALFAHDLTALLEANHKPTLLILGREDELFKSALKNAKLGDNYRIAYTSHHSLLRQDQDKLAEQVTNFMKATEHI